MSEMTTLEPIEVSLKADQIADLIYQQLEDNEDADAVHARYAIDFTIRALDDLGLIVLSGGSR